MPERLPPNQRLVTNWPVLHYGTVPSVDPARFRLSIGGMVEAPFSLSWAELMALPQHEVTVDIHCVTGWSRYDNRFSGVRVADLIARARPKPGARYAVAACAQGFTTNLPLDDLMRPDVLFAHAHGSQPLSPEHGGPLRLMVPHLYFWKSAKWVHGLDLVAEDEPGFWERAGYHMRGDPWQEQRFQDDL